MSFFWLKTYMPRSLYGRATLILVLPVLVLLLVVSIAFSNRHLQDVTTQMSRVVLREMTYIADSVAGAPHPEAALAALAPQLDVFEIKVRLLPPDETVPPDLVRWFDVSASAVRRTLRGTALDVVSIRLPDNREVTVVARENGQLIEYVFNRRRVTAAAPHQLIVTMLFFAALMTAISFLYMRNQLRPITRLAAAAQAFGRGQVVPYHPAGAVEVRAAGGAFLDMRARIERQIEQRTLMLSGVSHDLRTPLTRMKLELAMLDPDDAAPLVEDVDEMQRLIDEFLDFAKGTAEGEPEKTDPKELVRQVVADAARAGQPVTLVEASGEGSVMLRPLAIRRAVENLVGNALRYGNRAEVSVALTDKSLRIRVEDDGPGIPPELRAEAVKPFSRLDPARNQNKGGGVGLGLAIVSDIARAHGGLLRLSESEALGGLRADIVIGR
ncbi:ATP-binding protein [Seohaeicola zhoushanensis]|uniref:histidine kinase n=1 Tax=Seohaeicola zhoushanensis TaxID=1569283 RepID=A0A8J3M7X1_9RHOB|nr:ATP-binding protein [Seohaeicola zhoushanensis]GHF55706.1 two-component sensor histidine kinase [Seohaeicola zhoushanensis]